MFFIPWVFFFAIYLTLFDALWAVNLLNQTTLDGNVIRVDFDIGFSEGRQFGRGFLGGQVRDEVKRKPDFRKEDPRARPWDRGSRDDRKFRGSSRYGERRRYKRVK